MASVIFTRGTTESLQKQKPIDGLLSFTTDDGRIHLDYTDDNNEIKRMTFYSGKLTFGNHIFDGTQDVTINLYNGEETTNE